MASMNILPPSPFSSAVVESAEALPADISGRDHLSAGSRPIPADEQRHPFGCPDADWCRGNRLCYWQCNADPDATDHIGEIFIGARKLEQLPGRFDPDAITGRDELLYVTLNLMDEPGTPDLPCIPDEQAFMDAIEPPPLFLQRAG